jgi:hypothetical protein
MRKPFDRLIEKVEKSPDGCWNWTAAKSNVGYGLFWMCGRYVSAHRASWEIANGKIPDGACVLHRCDNRLCVNPEHMYVGTLKQNMRDRQIRDRCNKKLSISDVKKIRADNRSTRKIGKDYGVSGQTVHAIKAGLIWRYV